MAIDRRLPPSIFLRTPFNYDRDDVSRETGFSNVDADGEVMPSMTQQNFADECDINTIVRRFGLTGELPQGMPPQFGDFSEVTDFASAMNAIRTASEGFMSLPGHVREEFANDPARAIAFLENPANRSRAIELGLIPPPPVQASGTDPV